MPGRDETWLLREYVELTFERLHALRFVAVAADGSRCLFDTGLTTAEDAAVYGLCLPAGDADGPPWALQGWIAEGDARLADRFAAPPGRAVYTADPADLVYDWRHPLAVNPRALLESPESAAALPAELRANPYLAGLVMEGAVRRAEARVRRDPRAAVPAWDPAAERVRLLLPLSLSSPESVDVALVVAREDSAYRGVGILALDVARARARVVSGLSAWITA
ncbi:DUF3825 domain-containing protein [Actinocorallia sp. API 0066]|nr:DUF3825 domain-containing protein [Actinocorallia sp. API 0066]